MNQIVLTGLLPAEICEQLELPQKFRGTQIFKWVGSGITDFDAMTNLSADLRNSLKEKAYNYLLSIGVAATTIDSFISIMTA